MTKGTKNDEFKTFHLIWTRPRDDDARTQAPVKRTYTNIDRAVDVAQKMALANPGRKFFVLTAALRVRTVGDEMEVAYNPDLVQVEEEIEDE